uniref:Peptidase A1 domain-containing protein n=1 Tax=Oryza glumipatula TaxID=40148 RepID=A0A0E0A4A3_9ORYZ
MADMVDDDQRRADYIQKRLTGATDDKQPMAFDSKTSQYVTSGQYATNGAIGSVPHLKSLSTTATTNSAPDGTSAVTQTVIIDSGSDVSWVQCKPCPLPMCHRQRDPLFDPAMSTTYAAVPCTSAACAQLGPYRRGCSANAQCQFGINYGDGSTATGTYSFDDLTLGPYDVIRGFRFGCAHADRGSAFDYDVAGSLALGGGSQSLVQQTATRYGRVFSYCLPPTASSLGFLVLGVPPERAQLIPSFVSTPLLSSSMAPTFYRVLLRAIIVAGRPLAVPPAVFSASSVIDSSTIISRLPPTAYQALRAAFRSAMTMYRAAPPVSILDTCYDFTGVRSITLPSIALVFDGGATVNLDAAGILLGSCLAFAPTASDRMPGFIGNVQQKTLEVVYDVPAKAMRFRTAAC